MSNVTSTTSTTVPSQVETVKIRPITFAEIEALAHRDAEPVEVYLAEQSRRHGLTFTPATLTTRPRSSRSRDGDEIPHDAVYAAVPNTATNAHSPWREDKDTQVGHVIACETRTMFGTSRSGWLFTSEEAERSAADARGHSNPAHTRTSVYVEDLKGGREERLTPVFGAQVTTGFIVEGIDADEALARTEAVLRAEFGDALRQNAKFQSRPVKDLRVNLYTVGGDRKPIALNVLDAEISYYMRSGAVDTEEADPTAPMPVIGT